VSGVRLSQLDTSLGPMLAAFTTTGLAALDDGDDLGAFGEMLSRRFGTPVRLDETDHELERQLDEYLRGRRRAFDIAIDLDDLAAFHRRALTAVRGIPYGETRTYGEVAAQVGHPGAARAVGNALSRCPVSIVVPCHRVVRAIDGVSGWGGNLSRKRTLLALERTTVSTGERAAALG
jgi:O-6-methylguanine DNA methyltransferase